MEKWKDDYDYFVSKIIGKGEHTFYLRYEHSDTPYVFINKNSDYNKEYCVTNKLHVFDGLHNGGVFLLFKGDFITGRLTNNETKFSANLLHKLWRYLQSKGINTELNGNDLLVEGNKIAGSHKIQIGDMWYSSAFISVNADNEIISKVVKKEQKKIPKGLSHFGVTSDEIEAFLISVGETL